MGTGNAFAGRDLGTFSATGFEVECGTCELKSETRRGILEKEIDCPACLGWDLRAGGELEVLVKDDVLLGS